MTVLPAIDYRQGPLPNVDYPTYRPFWDGVRAGEIRLPRCADCGKFHWYPQIMCPFCRRGNIEFVRVGQRGKVYTWTTVSYPFLPAYAERLPYIVVFVEFPEAPGVRFISNMLDAKPEEMRAGLSVEAVFHPVDERVTLPLFRLVRDGC